MHSPSASVRRRAGLSRLCYFHALRLGDAAEVAPIDKLSVVFVLLPAALFSSETLAPKILIDSSLIGADPVVLALK